MAGFLGPADSLGIDAKRPRLSGRESTAMPSSGAKSCEG